MLLQERSKMFLWTQKLLGENEKSKRRSSWYLCGKIHPNRLVFTRIQARGKIIMFVFSKTLEKLGNATQGPIDVLWNKSWCELWGHKCFLDGKVKLGIAQTQKKTWCMGTWIEASCIKAHLFMCKWRFRPMKSITCLVCDS